MEKISISEILFATGGKLLSGNTDTAVEAVCIDSREIKNNSLFVPIVGEHSDGHDFIKSAFENEGITKRQDRRKEGAAPCRKNISFPIPVYPGIPKTPY